MEQLYEVDTVTVSLMDKEMDAWGEGQITQDHSSGWWESRDLNLGLC